MLGDMNGLKEQVADQKNKFLKLNEMKYLKDIINNASKHYYNGTSIMMDKEWDSLYNQYEQLEKETRIILSNSPTHNVGYEVVSKLKKVQHKTRMLSLSKTKDINDLKTFIQNKKGILSYKLDGLTAVLSYNNGELVSAVTRGNGDIGEEIIFNARHFSNIPLTIPHKGILVLRGEAIISYSEFEIINNNIINLDDKYKNPRNLCSGTVRQLDSEICKNRNVRFVVFEDIENEGFPVDSKLDHFEYLQKLGFEIVDHEVVDINNIESVVEKFKDGMIENNYPCDGLVLTFDSILYGESLGVTSKTPRHSTAYKFKDDSVETTLIDIEWNTSRTGLVNPVAIFEKCNIEGTEVERASVHNISIIKELELGIGDTLFIIKSNTIIPQIEDNLTRSNTFTVPSKCPCCGEKTEIIKTELKKGEVREFLICTNDNCSAKLVGKLAHFCSRDALNIEGLSSSKLSLLVEMGYLNQLSDIYNLYQDENYSKIIKLEGFGKKSYENMIDAIEKSKNCNMSNFLYSLGINQIGKTASKSIAKYFNYDWFKFIAAIENNFDFRTLDDFGDKAQESIYNWYNSEIDNCGSFYDADRVLCNIKINVPCETITDNNIINNTSDKIKDLLFVITGSLIEFENRDDLTSKIESLGGKVSGSVSKNTTYLINNDTESNSSKNKKAKDLNVKIISEKDFLKLIK